MSVTGSMRSGNTKKEKEEILSFNFFFQRSPTFGSVAAAYKGFLVHVRRDMLTFHTKRTDLTTND